jgi:DUF971 family protein
MTPQKIQLHKKSAELALEYKDASYRLSAEFLRVHSPSAEVQGHGPDQKVVPLDKQDVNISNLEAQGNYAIKLFFDDGHDSGIYSWGYLRELAENKDQLWQTYLEEAKLEREKQSGESVVKWVE